MLRFDEWMNEWMTQEEKIYKKVNTHETCQIELRRENSCFFLLYSSLLSSPFAPFLIYTIIQFIYFYNKSINWIYILLVYRLDFFVVVEIRIRLPISNSTNYVFSSSFDYWFHIHYVNTHMIPSTHFIILLLLLILIRRFNIDIYILWYQLFSATTYINLNEWMILKIKICDGLINCRDEKL